jgi:hypothetical protein
MCPKMDDGDVNNTWHDYMYVHCTLITTQLLL